MARNQQRIEIVRTTTKGFSSMSHESAAAILAVLSRHYAEARITIVNDLSDLESLVVRNPDLVFLGMECLPVQPALGLGSSRRLWVTRYLDKHGIAYTGSGQAAHELGRDKIFAKQRALDAGLMTSSFCVIKQGELPILDSLSLVFPLFVKPTNRGGGQGIGSDSVVHTFDQLVAKSYAIAIELHADSLVEEYLPGREFSVAILRHENSSGYAAMPIELIAPLDNRGARILSNQVKSANSERAIAVTDKVTRSTVAALALNMFHALGGRDYGRIDIRLDAFGVPHFLEANLIPSLIDGYGSFPKACLLNIGLDYEAMILRIVKLGLARQVTTDNADQELVAAPGALVSLR